MAKFTVDTHLFRELGELLVGRDSTALVELIKNAYDADAMEIVVYGESLDDPKRGLITISDNGVGMTSDEFTQGFLRIASRLKEEGQRLSKRYKRRYSGAKGIGRLAAHKLARFIRVHSIPWQQHPSDPRKVVDATIDWDIVERHQTLDDLENTEAIIVNDTELVSKSAKSGTVIQLRRLRRRWTSTERGQFLAEVQTFAAPPVLVSLPKGIIDQPLLLKEPIMIRESSSSDPGFKIKLEGEFTPGEDYWQNLAQAAHWVIEIDARNSENGEKSRVHYAIIPTRTTMQENFTTEPRIFSIDHPAPDVGPFFHARILVREGGIEPDLRGWAKRASGVRVFMEGFRVLPYGEPRNDWLGIDADYTRRQRSLSSLQGGAFAEYFADEVEDRDAPLVMLRNDAYFGAVFLTQSNASSLRMLVNREGFIPEAGFETLVDLVRKGIDLSTRVRASASLPSRQERRVRRASRRTADDQDQTFTPSVPLRQIVEESITRAKELTTEARQIAATGNIKGAAEKFSEAIAEFEEAAQVQDKRISESAILGVLASVGTQMAAFIHEINGLLGMTEAIDSALSRIREDSSLPRAVRQELAKLQSAVGDLRRNLERQAAYLVDVVTPDARRRRVRQSLAGRFDAGMRLVGYLADRRGIKIINEIPSDLKSPAMFPAELTTIFSNLLTNAVKAAGEDGKIRATAVQRSDGTIALTIENIGVAVDLEEGERWFRPFESTTTNVDPVLGQGMGLGLPITRNLLEEYGARIRFVRPSRGYATAVEIIFPQ